MITFKSKPNYNKKTKQMSISIPKRKLSELKHRIPKEILWKIEEMKY